MTAETLAKDNLTPPANDDIHQLQTVNSSGNTVTLLSLIHI